MLNVRLPFARFSYTVRDCAAPSGFTGCEWLALALAAAVIATGATSVNPYVIASLVGSAAIVAAAGHLSPAVLGAAAVLPLSSLMQPATMAYAASIGGQPIDPVLMTLEGWIGHPTVAIRQWAEQHPTVYRAAYYAYMWSPGVVAAVAALEAWRGHAGRSVVILASVATAAGVALYHVFPAVGPLAWLGADWPAQLALGPTNVPLADLDGRPRNAMPSLHFTWAALAAMALWPHGWAARVAGVVFVGLTVVATCASGEHYAVDLLGAVPLVAAVWAWGQK